MDSVESMDKILVKKKGIRKKHLPYVLTGAVALAAILWLALGNHASKMRVEREKLVISTVAHGEFNDYVRINGQVQPISTIQLSAIEGGMVAEKLVEEGSMVKAGEIVVRLTNPNTTLSILSSEADLAEKQNHLRNTQVQMEQDKLNLRKERLQYDMTVERTRRAYEQRKKLYDENLIPREEYLQTKEEYDLARNNLNLIVERQKQDSLLRTNQVEQMNENLDNMRKNVLLIRQRVENLNVRAPVDGQLGLLDVEIGQNVPQGGRIGQISVLSDYKVEASVDEHYIDRIRPGLDASFERQDKHYSLRVRKAYPEVREKQFKTDFVFEGERPDNIRAGQTYYINLQLGQPVDAVIIPRGPFYQVTGGKWIFVVTPDGSKAVRRDIAIGRQNPHDYEVLSGLEPGEKVITSSYDTYKDIQELILK